MRKVIFTLDRKLPYPGGPKRNFNRQGLFHGFFIDYFDDGDKNVQCTSAYIEDVETGIVHKLDTDDFQFVNP
jgi:hypothetical protein